MCEKGHILTQKYIYNNYSQSKPTFCRHSKWPPSCAACEQRFCGGLRTRTTTDGFDRFDRLNRYRVPSIPVSVQNPVRIWSAHVESGQWIVDQKSRGCPVQESVGGRREGGQPPSLNTPSESVRTRPLLMSLLSIFAMLGYSP